MNKIEIYPRVTVYKNTLPKHKEYTDLLRKSEKEEPKHFFKEWSDWYGFGTMMNLPMNNPGDPYQVDSDDEYALLQKDFLQAITDAYYACTADYVMSNSIQLPNWVNNGISICKYWISPEQNKMAMHYHTDYRGFDAESPGKKYAITCTIYINDDYDGGGLSFLKEDSGEVIDYKPEAGDIVIFPSGDPITGASHYFHGVDRVDNGEKYFIRCFWSYDFEGTPEWHANKEKYGDEWEKMDSERMKEEIHSGKWHKYLVKPDEVDPKLDRSTPFFMKDKNAYKKIR
ncbi:MAG: 2OG-Fe(II) oxygenase [Nitrososphaeria archaeon]|jgi:hypothetical protein|nr:2OG-Fe(II) oxygenase [Nitrososphaeria archaeon]